MARAFEITVWKPHVGKRAAFMKSWAEVAAIFKENGVSDITVLNGHAGKDVGHIVIIQTFKSLTDNGIVNDAIGESQNRMLVSRGMASYMSSYKGLL